MGMNSAPNCPTQSTSCQIWPSTNKDQPKEKDFMWLPPRLCVGSFTVSLIIHIYNRKKSETQIPGDEKYYIKRCWHPFRAKNQACHFHVITLKHN